MAKWFDDKFSEREVRKYTRRRLSPHLFEKVSRKLSITNWLIIINVVVFILMIIFKGIIGEEKFFSLFAIQAKLFFSGVFWPLLTSIFLHGGIEHLLANMVSLFFIGNFVEKLIGRKRFLWFYLIAGIFASFFYVILSYYLGNSFIGARIFSSPETFAVGASGAIFALLGILAVLTPKNKVYLIAGPIIAIVIEMLLAYLFPASGIISLISILVTFYVLFSIFSMFSFNPRTRRISFPVEMPFWLLPIVAIIPLVIIGLFFPLPIGNTAHFGGLIAGLIYGTYLKVKYRQKTTMISKYFSR